MNILGDHQESLSNFFAHSPDASRLESGVAGATASSMDLVDHVSWRGIQLAAIVLLGWVIAVVAARLLAARLLRSPGNGDS